MSWSRKQLTSFAAQGAALRRATVSTPFTWSGAPGKTFCGTFSGLSSRRQIEAGPFEVLPDATLRVQISAYPAFVPALGQTLTVEGRAFLITEILQPLAGSDEWRIALGKA